MSTLFLLGILSILKQTQLTEKIIVNRYSFWKTETAKKFIYL